MVPLFPAADVLVLPLGPVIPAKMHATELKFEGEGKGGGGHDSQILAEAGLEVISTQLAQQGCLQSSISAALSPLQVALWEEFWHSCGQAGGDYPSCLSPQPSPMPAMLPRHVCFTAAPTACGPRCTYTRGRRGSCKGARTAGLPCCIDLASPPVHPARAPAPRQTP